MNRADLIAVFRDRVGDAVEPFLWSDDNVQEYLDDAHNEAAERARLIKDSLTAAICTIAVVANTAAYLLDPRILSVERAKLDLQRLPLELTSTPALDGGSSAFAGRSNGYSFTTGLAVGWETATGAPVSAALDDEGGRWKLTLVPIPTAADTLRLQVFRLPMASLTDDNATPEIPSRLHIRLVDWMEHRAFSTHDLEQRDEQRAADAAAIFTTAFGERIDSNARRKQEDLQPATTRFQF